MQRHRRALRVVAFADALVLIAGISAAVVLAGAKPAQPVEPHLVEREPVAVGPVLPSPKNSGDGSDADDPGELAARLRKAMQTRALGSPVSAMVVDPSTGRTLFRAHAKAPVPPASTAKLATATAALATMGPQARLTTTVVRVPDSPVIILVGGGDPTLASPQAEHTYPEPAQLAELAERTVEALRRHGMDSVKLRYDSSIFTGRRKARSWKPGYVPNGYVAPVTGLAVDEGRARPGSDTRVSHPPRAAAAAFAELLDKKGIEVRGKPRPRRAQRRARQIAAVQSPPLAALVERMLTTSDNSLAEALGRHVALAVGKPPTFHGATAAIEETLRRLGVPVEGVELYDCSGLSHRDRVTARALTKILSLAVSPKHPELRPVLTGLPVADYSGTLRERYERKVAEAAGFVRAKTGTLNRVSTLAGVAYRPNGEMLVFAFLAGHVPMGGYAGARKALDRLAAIVTGRVGGS